MANSEACDLYIEQQIQDGLKTGKTPYAIGKEIADWVEKLFETKIFHRTIEQKARRIQDATNVASAITPSDNYESEQNQEFKWGGKREGAGRPLKYTVCSGDNEWYTPIKYIEAAREVMGGIDLDPATSEFAQSRIEASDYYTAETNGLAHTWYGRVWMNPPFSQPLVSLFVEKFIHEYISNKVSQGIILTNNATDTHWFHNLANISNLICFTLGRIRFEKEDGEKTSPVHGQAFFYAGINEQEFSRVFSKFGFIR